MTFNKMVDPSELEQSTPQKSQYISGKKETIRTVLIATHLLTNNSRNNLELYQF
jgi:hypothetical protein